MIGIGQRPGETSGLGSGHLAFADAPLPGKVLLLECLPAVRLIGVERAFVGKQLQHAEKAGDGIEQIAVGVLEIEQRQFLDQRVSPDERASNGMRSAVRRAQHNESRPGVRTHSPPELLTVRIRQHRTHDEAAHRVGNDSYRLILRLRLR